MPKIWSANYMFYFKTKEHPQLAPTSKWNFIWSIILIPNLMLLAKCAQLFHNASTLYRQYKVYFLFLIIVLYCFTMGMPCWYLVNLSILSLHCSFSYPSPLIIDSISSSLTYSLLFLVFFFSLFVPEFQTFNQPNKTQLLHDSYFFDYCLPNHKLW